MFSWLIIYLSEFYPKNILEACSIGNPLKNLCDYKKRVEAVKDLNNAQLIENANRVVRILKDLEGENVDKTLFTTDAEKNLYEAIKVVSTEDYTKYIEYLESLNPFVTKFFEDVLVMDKDELVKNNRIALLTRLKSDYQKLADFSKI